MCSSAWSFFELPVVKVAVQLEVSYILQLEVLELQVAGVNSR